MSFETEILAPGLSSFISKIDSVATLEILLFFRQRRDRTWNIAQVASDLRSSNSAVENRLEELARRGLLEKSDGGYRYRPATPELDELVGKVGRLYSQYQVRVIDHIYSAPKTTAQELADAFRIKKEEK